MPESSILDLSNTLGTTPSPDWWQSLFILIDMIRAILEIIASAIVTVIISIFFGIYILAPFGSPTAVTVIYIICIGLIIGLFTLIRKILFRWPEDLTRKPST